MQALSGDQPSRPGPAELGAQLRRRGVPVALAIELHQAAPLAPPAPAAWLRPADLFRGLSHGSMGVITGAWSSGKTSLALSEVARVTGLGRPAAVVDGTGHLFPPAIALLGGRPERTLILVPPPGRVVWTAEQVLRSGLFDLAVLLGAQRLALPALRRLQLAAEGGGARGLLVSPFPAAGAVSLRLRAEPLPAPEGAPPAIAAPVRRCRVRISGRGPLAVGPPRWAQVDVA